jgi:demethylmenaquinone methyltransferase/2-methoxy-6-polyprenyl-1,4-benzoquinol methylase
MASKNSPSRICWWLALPLLLSFGVYQYVLFAGVPPPSSDFGSGFMFDLIATRYDFINRVLAVGMDVRWRQVMVEIIESSVQPDARLLDMATGTADVALLLHKQMPQAQIVGLDPSNNMLDVGRTKTAHTDHIHLQQADAQQFATLFGPNHFDGATMAFGIRNVPDRNKALCEIHQVLKDQARFCILEFSEPDDSFGIMGQMARWFIRNAVPTVGAILSGAPREYWHLQNSIQQFPSPKEFGRTLESLECAGEKAFRLDEIRHLNFGSVQIYSLVALKQSAVDS